MNSVREIIEKKRNNVLNVYFTAGHPLLNNVKDIIFTLQENGVDLIELGLPYSDPLADGLAIQKSSDTALKNGMNLNILFNMLKEIKDKVHVPIILMGYFNQMLQFGEVEFLDKAKDAGVAGFILPDLPMNEYELKYKDKFEDRDLSISFLITPLTEDERIRQADRLSSGFVYVVSQSSITGKTGDISQKQVEYFNKINQMELKSPTLIGFGIHDRVSFSRAAQYANGAIVGSAFIRVVDEGFNKEKISSFIQSLRD
jgi:tryptophan synthase alpha chain